MAKKGQLTVFIIIGLLILLLIGILLYVTRESALAPLEAEETRIAEVPTELQPVQDYVQDCIYIVAKQGIKILGERGGYIEPRQRINPFEPTEGSAVQFAPESQLTVPYWWHLSSKNKCIGDCVFESERPPLTRAEGGSRSIEGQLDSYIAEKIPDCLGGFQQFREQQRTILPAGQMRVQTKITAKDVTVHLNYPLEVQSTGQTATISEFVAQLPVNLRELYLLGTHITNLQAEHAFLERATRNLIDVFGRADEDALPPVTEMEFEFGPGKMWTKFEIEDKLKQVLASYVPLLKVTLTKNYRYLPSPKGKDRKLYEILYNRGFTIPVLEPNRHINVRFVYLPWWKPYFGLNCNGQLCQAEGISNTLGFIFGVRRYSFAYDISYPVLVELQSPDAFGGEGYTFRFFLETNLRNNEPLAKLEPPLTPPLLTETESLLCDESQRTGGNATISVITSTKQPVDNAVLLYRCGTETCNLGISADGKLFTAMPRCVGGIITASHKNYRTGASLPFSIIDDTPKTATLTFPTPHTVDFSVKKWLLKKRTAQHGGETTYVQGWELDESEPVPQGPREQTIIILERKGRPYEEPITIVGTICGSPFAKASIPCGNPPSDDSKNITIYAGDYHVTIYSFMYPSPALTIPPDRRCVSTGFGRKKCYRVPPKTITFSNEKQFMSGYAELDWTITDMELENAKEVEFYFINFALERVQPAGARKIEDLEIMGNLFSYSEQYEDLLVPQVR